MSIIGPVVAASSRAEESPPIETFKYCDIVMKGGITSGVVYPPAVVELSKTYSFRNIGGTSAGAIAAAVTAAAEYGRQHNRGGFAVLAELPRWLGEPAPNGRDSHLFSLFQPQRETKGLFRILKAAIGNKRGKPLRIFLATIYSFPIQALVGGLPGLLLAFLASRSAGSFLFWWSLLSAATLFILGVALLLLWGLYKRTTNAVTKNRFGICSGFSGTENNSEKPLALTPWLSRLVNRAAGWDETGPPLTFGNLWGLSEQDGLRSINLEMMTTNLTHGRPYRLPFRENIFYFHPTEWRELFPEEVVKWMEDHPRETDDPDKHRPLRPLPATADLPVVVAARLSLSFPVLLSAIPLYAIDYGRSQPEAQIPEKCWFSDGGICSNFPVHFFDQGLPRWPTFAINLRPYHPDYPDNPVWMPDTNVGGISEWWTRFDQGSGPERLSGFISAIVNAMQNWMDNTQTHLPGYRDRVAHISLNESIEGGINLNMPPALISSLSERGLIAAATLVERFTTPAKQHVLSWDNHRWVRYRSLMELLEQMLERINYSIAHPMPGELSYFDLIRRAAGQAPHSYRWLSLDQEAFADQATHDLLDLIDKWRQCRSIDEAASFGGSVPRPQPELRVRPRI
jgi:predicted acylesterase/phospholipase RssA